MSVDKEYAVVVGAALGLSDACARVAALLLQEAWVSRKAIDAALGLSDGSGRAYIKRLRKALEQFGIEVHFDDGAYFFDRKDRERLSNKVARFNH